MWTFGDKFREMILYIAKQSEQDPRFGMVKLQKLMYYADFTAYRKLGRSISTMDYYNAPNGPMAEGLSAAVEAMTREQSLEIHLDQRHPNYGPAQVVKPRRDVRSEMFTDGERAVMDEVVQRHWSLNGREISRLVHEEPGWKLTKTGEIISYQTAWLAPTKVTPEKIAFGKELAARYGALG